MYNNKNITGKTKIIDPNKDRVWIFWKWAPFINIKLRPLCDRQRSSYFWKVKSLKKKTVTQVFVDSYLIAAKKKKQKQMQKLKSNKKYCMEFSFQTELVPFSESKILRQVVCAVLWNTEWTMQKLDTDL